MVMTLDEKIHNIITEQLSISLDVEKMSNRIKTYIIDDANKQHITTLDNGIRYKQNTIMYNIFGQDYSIQYKIYMNVNPNSRLLYGTAYVNDNELDLCLCLLNGNPYSPKFDNIIFHECLHIYQYIKSKKDVLCNDISKTVYNRIKDILNGSTDDNDYILANALYMTFEFEQDAMVHGLYGILINVKKERLYDIFLKSEQYLYLKDMEYVLENKDIFDYSLFNMMSKNKILKMIRENKERYIKKLMHVYQNVYDKLQYTGI